MYLSAHRVRRLTGVGVRVGIDAFLYEHDSDELPEDMSADNGIVDQIANQNPGNLVAESVDLVPGGNTVLSFVDVVGREGLEKEPIREFLKQKEDAIENHFRKAQVPFTDSMQEIAVKFGIAYGLRGQEVREYMALADRAIHLFETREPPRWRTEEPWIVILRNICDNQEKFSLAPETAKKLREMHGEIWVSSRVSIDGNTKRNLEGIHGDFIQYVAPILTDLTLEQIAIQGGLVLYDPTIGKKIKWPQLKEI